MSGPTIKSFGTFLVSNSSVSFQSTRYKLTQKKSTIVPPAELNPITQWANLLQSVKNPRIVGKK